MISKLDGDEKEFCRSTAMSGLDPFEIEPAVANHVTKFWNKSVPFIREELMWLWAKQHWNRLINSSRVACACKRILQCSREGIKTAIRSRPSNPEHPWEAGAGDIRTVLCEPGRALGPFSLTGMCHP